VLTSSERARIQKELVLIEASTEVVLEHLTVAAARSGTGVSEWTEARLDALIGAARELHDQVAVAPIAGD
jgi:hypothetical protein